MRTHSRLVPVLLVALVAAALWWRFGRSPGPTVPPLPETPAGAVESFMGTVARLNTLMWEEEERDRLRAEAEALEEQPEDEVRRRTADICEQYGLVSPLYLFTDPEYGKAVQATFLIQRFDSYEIGTPELSADEGMASVEVTFMPSDVLGINEALARRGAPALPERREPVAVVYHLQRRDDGWCITDLSGGMEKAIEAFYKLSQMR